MLTKLDLDLRLSKKTYREILPGLQGQLAEIQAAAVAADLPVLLILEGAEAAGKGSLLRALAGGLNPDYTKVRVFDQDTARVERYPWLRPFWLALPPRGRWTIFAGSWYRRVLNERLHHDSSEKEWRQAYRDILEIERTLSEDGYLIVKLFLHLSKRTQAQRMERRRKHRFEHRRPTSRDWEQNLHYTDWLAACEEMFAQTDSRWAPWHLIPSNNRRYGRIQAILDIVNSAAGRLGQPSLADSVFELQEILASEIPPAESIQADIPAAVPETSDSQSS